MVENANYIDPFWGSPWDTESVKRERAGFYSKPPLTMWLMAAGLNLFGFTELGVRFFFPILMILAILAAYMAIASLYDRRTALIAITILGTCPFVVFLARQAVTDGPLVAIMTIAMMALSLALCDPRHQETLSPLLRVSTCALFLLVAVGQLWIILPLDRSPDVVRDYPGSSGGWFAFQWWIQSVFEVGRGKGWFLATLISPLVVWAGYLISRLKTNRSLLFVVFYICCGLLVSAKGWLGWAPIGLSILGFLIVTNEWRVLGEVHIPLGLLVVLLTGHIWVIAMLCGHHPGWYNRFIIHDHYQRLFAGVHDLDDGGFEYFFHWLGVGMIPWVALVPTAVATTLTRLRRRLNDDPQRRFELLLLLWATLGFFLFSKSSTKFHHYIFPVVPPIALLASLHITRLARGRLRFHVPMIAIAIGTLIWVGQDIARRPNQYTKVSTPDTKRFGQLSTQNFVNLFTYKYERQWPTYASDRQLNKLRNDYRTNADGTRVQKTETEQTQDEKKVRQLERERARVNTLEAPLKLFFVSTFFGLLCLLALGLLPVGFGLNRYQISRRRLRGCGFTSLLAGGLIFIWYAYFVYLPEVSEDWSQKKMWDVYYADCTPIQFDREEERIRHYLKVASRVPSRSDLFPRRDCAEPIIAFRTNWRGEAFYSANTILPALEKDYLKTFLKEYGEDNPFYVFTEKSRIKSELEPTLPKKLKGKYKEVFGANVQFVLLKFEGVKRPR